MEENKIVTLRQPGEVADPLTEVLRNGARALLAQAVEAEVAEALAAHAHLTTDDGRRRLVRHGHMPERAIQTGIGPVAVRQPRVRDRGAAGVSASGFPRPFCRLMPAGQRASMRFCQFVFAGYLDRRHAGGARRLARQGCTQPIAGCAGPAKGGLAGGVRALEKA